MFMTYIMMSLLQISQQIMSSSISAIRLLILIAIFNSGIDHINARIRSIPPKSAPTTPSKSPSFTSSVHPHLEPERIPLKSSEFRHHNFTGLEAKLLHFNKSYPHLTNLYSIGKSIQGRDLYVIEISDNPGVHEPGEPEIKYVANINGNQVVGREMLLLLAQYLLQNYGKDDHITRLVKNTRIHFLISMNPDGYEKSILDECQKEDHGQGNANRIDLNRNFPDQFGTLSENRKQEPEVVAVMKWSKSIPFVLSLALLGGELQAKFPYDLNRQSKNGLNGRTPDDDLFKRLALVFSNNHGTMHLDKQCPANCDIPSELSPHQISNVANKHVLYAGMQNWNYLKTNCFEITVWISCQKYPRSRYLKQLWNDNKPALLAYMEEVHRGVKGFVFDSNGKGIERAFIHVVGIDHDVQSASDGDYWRLLLPGKYTLIISKKGYKNESKTVDVKEGEYATQVNFTLGSALDHHQLYTKNNSNSAHDNFFHFTSSFAYAIAVISFVLLALIGLYICYIFRPRTPGYSSVS